MSRAPLYHDDNRFRIISAPSEQWIPQRKNGGDGKGQNKYIGKGTRKAPEKPHDDGWLSIARPMDKATAEAFMNNAAGHVNTKS